MCEKLSEINVYISGFIYDNQRRSAASLWSEKYLRPLNLHFWISNSPCSVFTHGAALFPHTGCCTLKAILAASWGLVKNSTFCSGLRKTTALPREYKQIEPEVKFCNCTGSVSSLSSNFKFDFCVVYFFLNCIHS